MEKSKTEWDFSALTKDDFQKEREKIKKSYTDFRDKWRKNSAYLENPETLREALEEYDTIMDNYNYGGAEFYFYWLKSQLDQTNPELKAKLNKAEEFAKENSSEISFFGINISKIPEEKQKIFLKSKSLEKYKHFLEKIFAEGKYILSEKEEKIMSMKSSGSYSFWVDMLSGFLSAEEGIVLDENLRETKKSYAEINSLTHSQNPKVRKKASEVFNKIIEKYEDVAENELNAVLEHKKVNDKIRCYERPDKSRHVDDDIESEVVDALIKSVSEKGFKLSQRFYKLKAKILGMKKFTYSDRNIEYGKISKNLDFENSSEIVKKVFSDLDAKFGKILEQFLQTGNIDAFPKKGKRDGAFCIIQLKNYPVFVMLNHTNKLKDVLTYAHEMGHAVNDVLMKEKQNSINIGNPKSIAEVASTFMEDFVLQELLKNIRDEDEKLIILIKKLQDDVQTIVRQSACYKFEQELHESFREKGYLSKKEIGEIFSKNMLNYLGETFEKGKDMENGWIYWPHIREYFYVYSYASGLLISKSLQNLVRENPKNIEKVKEFFSAGTSESPKNIFLKMGIDISDQKFWEKGLDEIENLLDETEALAKKLGKLE
jgi:oligoendopeptidase F